MKHERLCNLAEVSPLIGQYLDELRHVQLQLDRSRFRHNIRRIAWLAGAEIAKRLQFSAVQTKTPLGVATGIRLAQPVVVASVLRAGLPFHEGLLDVFDSAESAFIGASRVEAQAGQASKTLGVEVALGYVASPQLDDKVLIFADPMLATGSSLIKSMQQLLTRGKPRATYILAAIASEAGVRRVLEMLPEAYLFCAGIDPELNAQSYIVPGLGDAGDLCFGAKSDF